MRTLTIFGAAVAVCWVSACTGGGGAGPGTSGPIDTAQDAGPPPGGEEVDTQCPSSCADSADSLTPVWMHTAPLPSTGPRWTPHDLRAATSGATYLRGQLMDLPPTGELDLGFTSVTLPGTTDAPFVSRFDPDGNHQWTRAFVGTDGGPRAEQLVIAPAGEDLIVAIFTYALEPTLSVSGEQVLLGGTVSPTDGAVIVSRLTSAGTLGWSVTFPGARRLGLTASDDKLFFIDMGGPLLGGCELAVGADPILALDMSTGACAYRVMPSDARGIAPDGRGGLWVVRQGSGDPPRCNDYLEHYDSTGTVTWTNSSVTKGTPRPNDPFGCPRVDFVGPGVNGSVIVARSYPRNKDPDHTRKAPFTETRLDGSPGCYDHYQERAAGIYYFPDNYTTSVVVAPDNRAYTASVYGPFTKLRGPQQLCETAATMKGLPENPILCAHRERFEEVRVSDRLPSGGIAFHGSLGKGWLYKGPSNQCDTSAALQGPVAFFGVLAP